MKKILLLLFVTAIAFGEFPNVSNVYQYYAASPLSVTLTTSSQSTTVGMSITYQAVTKGGVVPASGNWNFGDGSSGTGSPVTHSYSAAGSYTVSYSETDLFGVSASNSFTETITNPVTPPAAVSILPKEVAAACAQAKANTAQWQAFKANLDSNLNNEMALFTAAYEGTWLPWIGPSRHRQFIS